jgi:hypothetical protein
MQYSSPFPGFRKSKILSRREEELRHALRNHFDPAKIQRAVERVRTAQLHLLKARQHLLKPYSYSAGGDTARRESQLQKIGEQKEFWQRRPVNEIIDEYECGPVNCIDGRPSEAQ